MLSKSSEDSIHDSIDARIIIALKTEDSPHSDLLEKLTSQCNAPELFIE
jgi:hypothetical protein